LQLARKKYKIDVNDSNIVAAERYAEGYFGNYGRLFILGQDFLKQIRAIPLIGKRFGKNGAPVSDSEFITTWEFLGVLHREEYIKNMAQNLQSLI